jgi:hypothetical protein
LVATKVATKKFQKFPKDQAFAPNTNNKAHDTGGDYGKMAFHIPFNQRASARYQSTPIFIGFEVPRPPRKKFNWWGFNGMWISFLSLLSAGFLSPVPLLISLIGLRRPGKKMATVGAFVSMAGVALATTIVLTSLAAHSHHQEVKRAAHYNRVVKKQIAKTNTMLMAATDEILEYKESNDGDLPSDIEANMLVIKYIDPWGESLRFDAEVNHGVIRSAGPDRDFDTKDDVTVKVDGQTDRQPLLPLDE